MYKCGIYKSISIPELFELYSIEEIQTKIDCFKNSKNSEVEKFLITDSIEFVKKKQAITYLILNNNNNELVAYFTLSIKPIKLKVENLSNNTLKKLLRISEIDIIDNTVNPSAYLIAQLGKCSGAKININDIFEMIDYQINNIQNECGGVIEFLEAENVDKLILMYESKGFKKFSVRKSRSDEDRKLIQMYRLI